MIARLTVPGIALAALTLAGCVEPGHVERRWTVMATYATVEVHATDARVAQRVADEVHAAFETVNRTMSNWSADSDLSRLNREARARPFVVQDPDVFRCVALAREYARATGGAFDPTVGPLMRLYGFRPKEPRVPTDEEIAAVLPSVGWRNLDILDEHRAVRFLADGVEIDLGGIAKGYAVDVAARSFANSGAVAGLIDLGGNIYAWGKPPDRDAWVIGLRDPQNPERVFATVKMVDRAVATSGNYENAFTVEGRTYGHIMDAATGRPARSDVLAASAFSDGAAEADALSTAFFAGGSARAGDILSRSRRVEAVLLVETPAGLGVLASASLRDRLEIDSEFAARLGGGIRFILPPEELATSFMKFD